MLNRYTIQRSFKATFLLLFFPFYLQAPQQTITTAGYYLLGEDISYAPSVTNDSIIRISTSNVILDLGNRILSQANLVAGLTAVAVDQNLSNVIIKNGFIHTITGTGIGVNFGCSRITIDSINTFSCDLRGINITGLAASPVTDTVINNCSFIQCCRGPGDFAINLLQCTRNRTTNCAINLSGVNVAASFSGIRIENSTLCILQNIGAQTNSANAVTGFDLVVSSSCMLTNCFAQNNTAGGAGLFMTGFKLSGAGNSFNIFKECAALENAASGTVVGFDIEAQSIANLFQGCKAVGNSAVSAHGFRITGPNVVDSQFLDCIASHNSSTTGECAGFSVNNGADFGLIVRCIGSSNTSTSFVATGLVFQTGTGGTNWSTRESAFSRNIGSTDANSYGIRDTVGGINFFTRNTAFNNGTSQPNQMQGVPGGSSFDRKTTNLNSIAAGSGPWGNLDVIP